MRSVFDTDSGSRNRSRSISKMSTIDKTPSAPRPMSAVEIERAARLDRDAQPLTRADLERIAIGAALVGLEGDLGEVQRHQPTSPPNQPGPCVKWSGYPNHHTFVISTSPSPDGCGSQHITPLL